MMSLLLPYATTGLSLIAGWGWISATPQGQPRTPAMMLPHALRPKCLQQDRYRMG